MGSKFGSQDSRTNTQNKYNDQLRQQNLNAINQYTGNAGYLNSINQGAMGAAYASQGAASQAAGAARTAGMSKAEAASVGADAAAQGYYNAFAGQQGAASNAGNSAVSSTGQAQQNQLNRTQLSMQQKDAEYNRAWGNVGNALGIAGSMVSMFSDSNLKTYYKLSSKYKRED